MKHNISFIITLFLLPVVVRAQVYHYEDFMQSVLEHNPDYAAEQLNVEVSQADVIASRMGQDPSVSFGYDNNSDWDIAMGRAWSVELSKPISVGKVAARTRLASKNLQVAQASLEDYRASLKAEASLAFADAVLARELTDIARRNLDDMQHLYASDSLRFIKGDISEIDMLQTRLEMVMARQEYLSQQAQYRNALLILDRLAGQPARGTQSIEGRMQETGLMQDCETLVRKAVVSRRDLAAARLTEEAAQAEVVLSRRERRPDVELSAAASYNTRVRNEEAPAPEFVGYSVGLSIPLPLSTVNRGVVRAGQYRAQQAQLQVQSLEAQVRVEVVQAFNSYEAARLRVEDYDAGLLDQSRQVLQGRFYAYQRGETSLLELLTAQHAYNDMLQSYAEALHDCNVALVALMRAVGE